MEVRGGAQENAGRPAQTLSGREEGRDVVASGAGRGGAPPSRGAGGRLGVTLGCARCELPHGPQLCHGDAHSTCLPGIVRS